MKTRRPLAFILGYVGLAAMFVGAVDPLEGSLVILPGTALAAIGASVGRTPRRRLLLWSFVLVAIGVGSLWGLSAVGGFGGDSGRSMWYGLLLLPYPVGWVIGLVGGVGSLRALHLHVSPR